MNSYFHARRVQSCKQDSRYPPLRTKRGATRRQESQQRSSKENKKKPRIQVWSWTWTRFLAYYGSNVGIMLLQCGFKADWRRNKSQQDQELCGQKNRQNMWKGSNRKAINRMGCRKKTSWTLRDNSEAFTPFRTTILMMKKIGNTALGMPLQRHHTNQLHRFKLEATLCKWRRDWLLHVHGKIMRT